MIIENFDDFYDHYQGFSAYVAFCITEDYELSKDISQEVFLALFKVKEKLDYSRPDKLKALVMKATSNNVWTIIEKPHPDRKVIRLMMRKMCMSRWMKRVIQRQEYFVWKKRNIRNLY